MPITIKGDQSTNDVDIPTGLLVDGKGLIDLRGSGARIVIAEGCTIRRGLHVTAGADTTVIIGKKCLIGHLIIFAQNGAAIIIGDKVGFTGECRLQAHEEAGIRIGKESLIAAGTQMTSSDMHSIMDMQTGERINPCKEIVVEEHVWIGRQSAILKGSRIGSHSVIGAHSVVTGSIPPNCVAVGIPARVVRTGVTWKEPLVPVSAKADQEPLATGP